MKRAAIAAALFVCFATFSSGSAQTGTAQLAFVPATSTAAVGASVAVDVTVANVAASPGLGGYDITIMFNPAVVRMDSLTDTGLLTGGTNIVICTPAQIDNGAGKATINCTPIPLFSSPGFSTTSPVALLHGSFTTLAAGTSSLGLAGSTLQSPSNTAIAATLSSGSITVTAAAQATPTPTTPTSATPRPSSTAAPSQTPAVTPSPAPAMATATSTPTPQSAGTVGESALQPPVTGTGSGSGGFRWPFAAASIAIAIAIAGAGALARSWRRRRA